MRGLIAFGAGLGLLLAGPAGATTSQGTGSCMGAGACQGQSGDIGDESCNGAAACQGQSGNIGDKSCNMAAACQNQSGEIDDGSCNGPSACQDQTGEIGPGLCNYSAACLGSGQDRIPCLGGGMAVSGAVGGEVGEIDIPGCWFVGVEGESCSEVCGVRGLLYDEASETVAGSDIDFCQAILGDGFFAFEETCGEGLGCFLNTGTGISVVRCTDPATSAEASGPDARRACACVDIARAPAISLYGIAALITLLVGFGMFQLRTRISV